MATLSRDEQVKLKEKQLFEILWKRVNWKWIQNPEDLWYRKEDLMRGMDRLKWWFMSLMNFSPETTILNISNESWTLDDYMRSIFEWLKITWDEKLLNDITTILEKMDDENPEKMLSSFIYDSALYFHENPLTLVDSDPAYEYFKHAENLSKKYTNGKYKIVQQEEDEMRLQDIDIKQLVTLISKSDNQISDRQVIKLLERIYWPKELRAKWGSL